MPEPKTYKLVEEIIHTQFINKVKRAMEDANDYPTTGCFMTHLSKIGNNMDKPKITKETKHTRNPNKNLKKVTIDFTKSDWCDFTIERKDFNSLFGTNKDFYLVLLTLIASESDEMDNDFIRIADDDQMMIAENLKDFIKSQSKIVKHLLKTYYAKR